MGLGVWRTEILILILIMLRSLIKLSTSKLMLSTSFFQKMFGCSMLIDLLFVKMWLGGGGIKLRRAIFKLKCKIDTKK